MGGGRGSGDRTRVVWMFAAAQSEGNMPLLPTESLDPANFVEHLCAKTSQGAQGNQVRHSPSSSPTELTERWGTSALTQTNIIMTTISP